MEPEQPEIDLSNSISEDNTPQKEHTLQGLDLETIDMAGAVAVAAADAQVSKPAGEGTQEAPYQITSLAELHWFAGLVNGTLTGVDQNTGACAKLMNDISFEEDLNAGISWTPIGYGKDSAGEWIAYTGTFDGNDKIIEDLSIVTDDKTSYMGMFGVNKGVIKNLNIVNAAINCGDITYDNPEVAEAGGAGIIAGVNYGEISSCLIGIAYVRATYGVGGIAGINTGLIKDTGLEIVILKGISYVGGVTGSNLPDGRIENVVSYSSVEGELATGGIAGENFGAIEHSMFLGKAAASPFEFDDKAQESTGFFCGGIAGYNNGVINDCETGYDASEDPDLDPELDPEQNPDLVEQMQDADISGVVYVGGIAGENVGTISECHNHVSVNGFKMDPEKIPEGQEGTYDFISREIGGIAGRNGYNYETEGTETTVVSGLITGCENHGLVTGGIVSAGDQTQPEDYGDGAYFGGIAGTCLGASIEECVNDGMVMGYADVGGIAGYAGDPSDADEMTPVTVIRNCTGPKGLITASTNIGGIVGQTHGAQTLIENCKFTGIVSGEGDCAGGIVGCNESHIKNCVGGDPAQTDGFCFVTAQEVAGGIAGLNMWQGNVEGCTSYGIVGVSVQESSTLEESDVFTAKGHYAGGIVGVNSASVSGCNTTGETMIGALYGAGGVAGANFGTLDNCGVDKDVRVHGDQVVGGIAGLNCDTPSDHGLEELEDPDWIEYVPDEWAASINSCVSQGKIGPSQPEYDADGNQVEKNYGGIGGVAGINGGSILSSTFSGTISDWISDEEQLSAVAVGGIAGGSKGLIDSCTLEGADISADASNLVGGVAGANTGIVKNIEQTGAVYIYGKNIVGGIVGFNQSRGDSTAIIENADCSENTYVCAFGACAGSAAGYNSGQICNSSSRAEILADYIAGGVAGYNAFSGVLENCEYKYSFLRLTERTDETPREDFTGCIAGGIVGWNIGSVTDCESVSGSITGDYTIGGVAGYNGGTVQGSTSTMTVTAIQSSGGIVGYNQCGADDAETFSGAGSSPEGAVYPGMVENCVNAGTIDIASNDLLYVENLGGIVGFNRGQIKDCINNGNVDGGNLSPKHVGGIAGYNIVYTDESASGTISGCENTGTVKGTKDIGGIVGLTRGGLVDRCSNMGEIVGSSYVGGIAGYVYADTASVGITSSYNTGDVKGVQRYIGGIAGYARAESADAEPGYVKVENCYNIGYVEINQNLKDAKRVGGILGHTHDAVQVRNCFYLESCVEGQGVYKVADVKSGAYGTGIEDFLNGHVAWSLQAGEKPGTLVWGQKLFPAYDYDSCDTFPVLAQVEEERVVYALWITDEEILHEEYTNIGAKLTDYEDEKDGYRLDGWYTDQAMTDKWDFETDTVGDQDTLGLFGKWVALIYGDVNANGVVDADDALLILQKIVGLKTFDRTQTQVADVNGDGGITADDALLVLQKIVGLIPRFPVEKTESDPGQREPATITVYSTNDIHGVVQGDAENGIIGLPQVSGIAASTENSILLDAGDATQGASFATVGSGEHVIDVMNVAGYSAMAAGNHEFDYGAETLLANAKKAGFPILSANVKKDGEQLLPASTVIERAGFKIGVVGITTASTATSTNPDKLAGITFENEVASAKEQIAALKDSVDAIILVTHLGDNQTASDVTAKALLESLDIEELAMIAAVIDGHSHTVENDSYLSIPIVQTGTQNKNLGMVTIEFNKNGNFAAEGAVWDYQTASEFALTEVGELAKKVTQEVLDECILDMDPILAEEIGRTGAPLWGGYIYYDYAEPRIVETTMGDLVTDAFRYYGEKFKANNGLAQPVIGLENGGGISATLPYGIMTRGDILNAFNHGNTVDLIKVTPSQLYEALEAGLSVITGQDDTGLLLRQKVSGSFLQVSGLTYTYDPAGEAGKKVVSVVLEDGTSLSREDSATELLVATNNYVTTFAGLKDGQKLGELGGEDSLVQDYVLHLTNDGADTLIVDKPAGRIVIAGDKSPESYEVVIPVKASDGSAYDFTGTEFEVVIDNDAQDIRKVTCQKDGLHLTVTKGAYTFYLTESADNIPVYTNNYSGSGTVTTADGYYHLYFTVDPAAVK